MTEINCPLCKSDALPFYKDEYFCCNNCKGLFVPTSNLPDNESEKARYEEHNNDENDIKYQEFVSPITDEILQKYSKQELGLDFGSGKSSSISKVLKDNGYNIKKYDPYFFNYPELLSQKYDYIACCEVIEHFYNPANEFKLLKNLLKEDGVLFCMTSIYKDIIDFPSWHYRRDKTHVFIYQAETLEWIKNEFEFKEMIITERLVQFRK